MIEWIARNNNHLAGLGWLVVNAINSVARPAIKAHYGVVMSECRKVPHKINDLTQIWFTSHYTTYVFVCVYTSPTLPEVAECDLVRFTRITHRTNTHTHPQAIIMCVCCRRRRRRCRPREESKHRARGLSHVCPRLPYAKRKRASAHTHDRNMFVCNSSARMDESSVIGLKCTQRIPNHN